jgi:hypothetical protein
MRNWINLLETFLSEKVYTDFPGSNHIIDLRLEKGDLRQTHITLTKDGGALIWNYGGHEAKNKIDWHYPDGSQEGVIDMAQRMCDTTIQDEVLGIRFTLKGVLIDKSREGGQWSGDRNRFSLDTRKVVERLLELRIVTPRTPIYLGNWARNEEDGELVGSVAQIMNAPNIPNQITLYHGTSNARAIQIMEHGLTPLDTEARVWNKDHSEHMPEHRADAVYMTASLDQAEYYASKAVKVDRKRMTWDFRSKMEWKASKAKTPEQISKLRSAVALLHKMSDSVGKVEPVVLSITLTRADYKYLMADDDFLRKMKAAGREISPTDWRESLSDFGQVAYRGTIPPSRITRLS